MTRIASTFTKGTDGWSISGDAQTFAWERRGGDTGGYLYWVDAATGAGAYWQASTKFLGDLSGYFTGKLSFSWYASGNDLPGDDIAITGANGHTLIGDVGEPGTGWTHESIRLSIAGHWHLDSTDGPLATTRQIKAVLADVTQILIRAEHVYGGESGGLDTVALTSKPAAAAVSSEAFGDDRHIAVHEALAAPAHGLDGAHLMLV